MFNILPSLVVVMGVGLGIMTHFKNHPQKCSLPTIAEAFILKTWGMYSKAMKPGLAKALENV